MSKLLCTLIALAITAWPHPGLANLITVNGIPSSIATRESAGQAEELSGWLNVVWGDGEPGSELSAQRYWLQQDDGTSVELALDRKSLQAAGGVTALNRRRVTARILPGAPARGSLGVPAVPLAEIALAETDESRYTPLAAETVTGSQPWISILCKFSDVATEPRPLPYFQGMYSDARPGLGHYWREQSYNQINVQGSGAVGWFTLPQPRSYYVYDVDGDGSVDADLSRLANDCTQVADAAVYFPDYRGINLIFNANLDCCAWGGGRYMSRDGRNQYYSMTWEPPWGYADITVMGHEMGHGFGLPHSSGDYGLVYDNQWDVMSDTWHGCSRVPSDPIYGCVGQHTIAYHKAMLGWVTPTLIYTAMPNGAATLLLDQLGTPTGAAYLMVKLPRGSPNRYYTLEARRLYSYDASLPGAAVIVHDVDTTRAEDAHVVDSDRNGNTGDAGAMLTVGESFLSVENGLLIMVSATTANGFRLVLTPSGSLVKKVFLPAIRLGTPGDDFEPDSVWQEARTIVPGAPQSHSIVPAADVDWVKFTLSAPSAITLRTSDTPGDTRLWLYNANLTQIDYNDDRTASDLLSYIDRQCGVDAVGAGVYYAKVDEWGNDNAIASYRLSLTASPCSK